MILFDQRVAIAIAVVVVGVAPFRWMGSADDQWPGGSSFDCVVRVFANRTTTCCGQSDRGREINPDLFECLDFVIDERRHVVTGHREMSGDWQTGYSVDAGLTTVDFTDEPRLH